MTVIFWVRPPAGTSADDCRAAVEEVVRRHEALRTTVRLRPDGRPEQCVHPFDRGRVRIERLPASVTRDEFGARHFSNDVDTEREWPAWACLFADGDEGEGGDVVELAMVVSHVFCDGCSAVLLGAELDDILAARRRGVPAQLTPVTVHMLDVVAADLAPDAMAGRAAATEYWREQLRRTPPRMFVTSHHDSYQLYAGRVVSTTAPAIFAGAARRYRATPGLLYSAAVNMLLAVLSGQTTVTVRTQYNGRVPYSARVVGCLGRELLTTVDLSDHPPLSTVVRRLMSSTRHAFRHCRIDWPRFRELEAVESLRRGIVFGLGSTVNFDLEGPYRDNHLDPALYPDGPPEPAPRFWVEPSFPVHDANGIDAHFSVRMTGYSMRLVAGFNGAVLAEEEMLAILHQPELMLHHALTHGDLTFADVHEAVGGLRAPRADGVSVRSSPVDPDQVEEILRKHPDVTTADVRVDDGDADGRLVATVATDRDDLSPAELREHVLLHASRTSAVAAPDHFIVCGSGSDGAGTWERSPRVGAGSGRERSADPSRETPAALALRECVAEYNGPTAPRLSDGYVTGGGSLIVVPAVLRRLSGLGYEGLLPDDFVRPVCLRTLATLLRRGA
jgi:hypothetical protein